MSCYDDRSLVEPKFINKIVCSVEESCNIKLTTNSVILSTENNYIISSCDIYTANSLSNHNYPPFYLHGELRQHLLTVE